LATLLSSLLVSALLALLPGVKPAGATVMVLPMLLLTLFILLSTAFWATSMVRLRPMLSPNIKTIDMVRVPFLKAFRMPLLTGFMRGYSFFRLILTGVYGADAAATLEAIEAFVAISVATVVGGIL
jgi:hypothetical protein